MAIFICVYRCLFYKVDNQLGGEQPWLSTLRQASTQSKICISFGLLTLIIAGIMQSASASKYFELQRIIKSNNFPSDFQSLVAGTLGYQTTITQLLFSCLWLVKISIVLDCKGFTEEKNLVWIWRAYVVILLVTLYYCLYYQPFSDTVCLPGISASKRIKFSFSLTVFRLSSSQ